MGDKSNVFVIMPFQDEFFEVYEMLKLNFQRSMNLLMLEMKGISKIY